MIRVGLVFLSEPMAASGRYPPLRIGTLQAVETGSIRVISAWISFRN